CARWRAGGTRCTEPGRRNRRAATSPHGRRPGGTRRRRSVADTSSIPTLAFAGDVDETAERLAAAALVGGHVRGDLLPDALRSFAPLALEVLLGRRRNDPLVRLVGVDLCVELGGPGRVADAEGLAPNAVACGEQRPSLGEGEGVHVPMEDEVAVRVVAE